MSDVAVSDVAVHFVKDGRYPHVVVHDGGASVRQTQKLEEISCAICLGDLESFLRPRSEDAAPAR